MEQRSKIIKDFCVKPVSFAALDNQVRFWDLAGGCCHKKIYDIICAVWLCDGEGFEEAVSQGLRERFLNVTRSWRQGERGLLTAVESLATMSPVAMWKAGKALMTYLRSSPGSTLQVSLAQGHELQKCRHPPK